MERIYVKDCPACMGRHDDEIHAATVRIHDWFRQDISSKTTPWQSLPPVELS